MSITIDAQTAFGSWLKRRRLSLNLTQDALAERLGCTPSMLQKIEQGVRRPSPSLTERLAQVLGVTPAERSHVLGLAQTATTAAGPGHPHDSAISSDATPPRPAAAPAATSAIPLLLTKMLPPRLHHRLVARARLTHRLQSEPHGDVVLVVAPAGSGKTTLLAAWVAGVAGTPLSAAWVTLDEHDTDITLVLRYIIAALQRQHAALGALALQLLATPQPSIEAVLTLLINDVIMLGRPISLVLDDYHRVRAPAIHQALTYVIEHLPPNMGMLIATREDPPLPLARLRARQQLHEIRAADLRFTTDEAADFFVDIMGLALPHHAIAALEQRTEGWITGMQLAALAMREHTNHGDFIHAFTGTHRLVLDYLAEEVLAHLPPHLHDFLLQTSILDRLCGRLCDAVLGLTSDEVHATSSASDSRVTRHAPRATPDSYSQLILNQLERANLFLVPLDEQRQWYRYHHLFGVVLRERLQRGALAARVAALHERAAIWFEAHGFVPEAIDHALAGSQWARGARLIAQIGDDLFQASATTRLAEMIEALPLSVRDAHPQLLYLLGLCARQVWNIAAARTLFEQAADGFGAAGDAAGRGGSLIYVADCQRMLGAFVEAHQALALALASPLSPARRAVAVRSSAYEAAAMRDWQAAIAYLNQALDLLEQAGDPQALHELAINLRSILIVLPGGIVCAERLSRLISRVPVAPLSLLRATDLFLSGMVRLIRGDLAAAYDDLTHALRMTEQLGALSQLSLETSVWLLRCAALMGDLDTASQQAGRLIALINHPSLATPRQTWGAVYLFVPGWLRWLAGQYDAARTLADEIDAMANSNEWPFVGQARRIMQALILLSNDDFAAAEHVLHTAYIDQQQFRDSAIFGSAGILLAYVYLRLERVADALAILEAVLSLHEQDDTPGLLLLTGAPVIVPLLRLALAHDLHAPFAARTLRLLPQPPIAPPQIAPNALPRATDLLTARELDVLRLIALGASNDEIAKRLVISLATVKKHINNIFAKLHAQNRIQALVHARERGFLAQP